MSTWQEAAKAAYLAAKESEEAEQHKARRSSNRMHAETLLRLVREMTGIVCLIDDVDMSEDYSPRLTLDGTTFSTWPGGSRLLIIDRCPRCGTDQRGLTINNLAQLGRSLVEFQPDRHDCNPANPGHKPRTVTENEWRLLEILGVLIDSRSKQP